MSICYIYNKNISCEEKCINYFKKQNITPISQDDYNNKLGLKIIIFSSYCNLEIISARCKILLLQEIVLNTKIFSNFNFIIPASVILFYKYISLLGHKLLFPLFTSETNINYIVEPEVKNYILKKINNPICTLCEDGIVIYDKVKNLSCTHLHKNSFFLKVELINMDYCVNKIQNIYFLKNKFCSNVKSFFDVKELNIIAIDYDYTQILKLEKNKNYLIVRNGFKSYFSNNYFAKYLSYLSGSKCKIYAFKIIGTHDIEFGIFYSSIDVSVETSLENIIKEIEYFDERVLGSNDEIIDSSTQEKLYYLCGKFKLYNIVEHYKNLLNTYDELIISFLRKINLVVKNLFCKNTFKNILYFWSGLNNYQINKAELNNFINNYNFSNKKVLLITKNLNSYGGSQKTTMQIYKELVKFGFIVKIVVFQPVSISNITPNDIIYINEIDKVIEHINLSNYEIVIINKINECIDFSKNINCKQIFISHNSMDPVHTSLLENYIYFNKILTVNNEHISLLYENNILCPVAKYFNYQNNDEFILKISDFVPRKKFKNVILFIGRISSEKNLTLLIDSFFEFKKINKEIKIIIIGDGDDNLDCKDNYISQDNIIFLGRLDSNSIANYIINCDYLCLPSYTEGMPYVIIEAMSLGIPIITSNINGCNELVHDDKTGFLYDIHNYFDYKNIINNFSIVKESENYELQNSQNLISVFKRAYSINIDKWNSMSTNCINFINEYFNNLNLEKLNINTIFSSNKIVIKTNTEKINGKIFLNKIIKIINDDENTTDYEILIKIYDYDFINMCLENNNFPMFLSKLNYIKSESYEKKINKIYDFENNYICFNNGFTECHRVHNLLTIFE
jgi:glycosyltransferase involved in cell wall biosynthesis